MTSQRHTLTIILVLVVVLAFFQTTQGKSVYVISNTETSQIQVYKINGSNLVHQTNYICKTDPSGLTGAVGLAIDESQYGEFLFFTFENTNEIELVNGKTMEYIDVVKAQQANNLAGIVVDKTREKVYIIDRLTNHLYVYSWNPKTKELTLDLPTPYYVDLEDCIEGYD